MWLQLSKGEGDIRAVLVTPDGKFNTAGMIAAKCGCWTMLKGGATSYDDGKGDIFFEVISHATRVDHTSSVLKYKRFLLDVTHSIL